MATPNGISGKAGRVLVGSCNVVDLTAWDLNYGADPQTYFPASANGAQAAVAGPEGGTGTFTFAIDTSNPPSATFQTGDTVTLELRHDTTGTLVATGTAVIGRIRIGADLSGPVQTCTVEFTTADKWNMP